MNADKLWQQFENEARKPAEKRDPAIFEAIQQAIDAEMHIPGHERKGNITERFGQWIIHNLAESDPWDLSLLLPDGYDQEPLAQPLPKQEALPIAASTKPPASKQTESKVAKLVAEAQERHELAARYGVSDSAAHTDQHSETEDCPHLSPEAQSLPQEQRDRFRIALKHSKAVSNEEVARVIAHWDAFMMWLKTHRYFTRKGDADKNALLNQAQFLFPLFFKHPR